MDVDEKIAEIFDKGFARNQAEKKDAPRISAGGSGFNIAAGGNVSLNIVRAHPIAVFLSVMVAVIAYAIFLR